jgi:hypothetical protein
MGCATDGSAGSPPSASSNDPGGAATTPAPPELAEPEPATDPPIACAGEQRIEATGLTIVSEDGPAIRASGHCQLTLTDSDVSGSEVGVHASESAQVVLRDSRVEGGQAAVVVSGRASVALPDSEVVGEVRLEGGAGDSEEVTERTDG